MSNALQLDCHSFKFPLTCHDKLWHPDCLFHLRMICISTRMNTDAYKIDLRLRSCLVLTAFLKRIVKTLLNKLQINTVSGGVKLSQCTRIVCSPQIVTASLWSQQALRLQDHRDKPYFYPKVTELTVLLGHYGNKYPWCEPLYKSSHHNSWSCVRARSTLLLPSCFDNDEFFILSHSVVLLQENRIYSNRYLGAICLSVN